MAAAAHVWHTPPRPTWLCLPPQTPWGDKQKKKREISIWRMKITTNKAKLVKLKGATSEWTALCRNVSPSHWRTSVMSSSLSRTPCWGLFCIRWSSDLHPLPELRKWAYIVNDLPSPKFSKSNWKNQIQTHLPLSCADEHIHCIDLMHLKLSLLMVLSAETKGYNHSWVDMLTRSVMSHTCWLYPLLLVRWVLDDSFLSINHVLFELMGQHACTHCRNKLSQAVKSWLVNATELEVTKCSHSPSIGVHLNDFAILFQASVTCVFWCKRHNDVLLDSTVMPSA